ncbi:DNA polymerase III subunit epsilon [Corynebacterium heidelbergense]|uniref:DNA polymerase III subunit epsilon n=1 Tax=Corynebacterium heidelbergense TaxID=2055947 RepID=UPI001057A586|nr:DNA polymerase III subunit epsilon [Corynebacterium heidelbergense]
MTDHDSGAPPAPRSGSGSPRQKPASRRPRRRVRRQAGAPRPRTSPAARRDSIPTVQAAPCAAVAIATSGIHPTTSRLIAVSVVFYAEPPVDGAVGPELGAWTVHLNPGEDAGPWHLHGYQVGQLAQAPGFASVARELRSALEGRTLLLHQAAHTWGFITQEYARAKRAAQRSRRGKSKNRPPKTIPTPVPAAIIDTLTTARMQAVDCYDFRLRAIAERYAEQPGQFGGLLKVPAAALPEVHAEASHARAAIPADTLLEADARLIPALHRAQLRAREAGHGEIAELVPADLVPDRFGLARSAVRVDAAGAPRPLLNPGVVPEGGPLVEGMEFVVSPDVATDPDELIARGVAAGLVYSEKLNRSSSLVVCNTSHELRGKAMHAHRKSIPLLSDTDFLALLADVRPGQPAIADAKNQRAYRPTPSTSREPNRRSNRGKKPAKKSAEPNAAQPRRSRRRRRRGSSRG